MGGTADRVVSTPTTPCAPRRSVGVLALTRVLLPLGVGVCTYLFRPGGERVAQMLGIYPALRSVRSALHACAGTLPKQLLGTLPDAAWGFAIGGALGLLWRDGGSGRARFSWTLVGGVAAGGYELGQLTHVIPGTFDVLDLIATVASYLCAIWLAARERQNLEILT